MISDIINKVKKLFRELSIVIGNNHNFLGISIEIKGNTIQFDMVEQLEDCRRMFGEDVNASVTSLATKKCF